MYKRQEDNSIPRIYDVKSRFGNGLNPPGIHALWAPDVVKGPDGRYYLYYCLDFLPEIGVAVCDTPAGSYEYLGLVRHKDGTVLGKGEDDLSQFDPVSYTHLDVYKRQGVHRLLPLKEQMEPYLIR